MCYFKFVQLKKIYLNNNMANEMKDFENVIIIKMTNELYRRIRFLRLA